MRIWQEFGMHIWHFRQEITRITGNNHDWNMPHRIAQLILERAGDRPADLERDVWPVFDEIRAQHNIIDDRTREQRIAEDAQNVHTREVTQQHNKNMEILLSTPVPEGQKTMEEIRVHWTAIFVKRPVDEKLYEDMQKWYDTESCRTNKDWLYRKTLDHLYARIKLIDNGSTRRELYKRLQQECAESYRMCCDGHLNRLTNVMVGFDDAFKQAMPKGLILQEKMAKIAQIEDAEERMKTAKDLMVELEISPEEAGAWLEAIGE
jgi:hypothetical protein